jgi:hypothetical protein
MILPVGAFVEGELYLSWMQFFSTPLYPLFFLFFSLFAFSFSFYFKDYLKDTALAW